MKFNVHLKGIDGGNWGEGNWDFLPRIGEEIRIIGFRCVVDNIIYNLQQGSSNITDVDMVLRVK